MITTEIRTEYKTLSLFSGIGGGALGFQWATQEWRGVVGKFRTLAGIDAVPEICEDFENITGAPGVCMDLFSREQYIAFHGKEPPEDWQEVTGADMRDACGGEYPDVVFTSPPCKGFSGLLPEASASTSKYQALNQLTVRGIKLCLDAFEDDLPALFILENVPRIATRGASLLNQIKTLLRRYGYAFHEASHDCGEIGGLAQIRKRFLLIARNEKKLSNFVYKPPKRPLKTIGEVLGPLPMPGDTEACGPLHRLPNLQWKVWMRLAMIPPGGDWRDLEKIDHTQYKLSYHPRNGAWGVLDWNRPANAVTGSQGVGRSNGAQAIADPRGGNCSANRHISHYRVEKWEGQSGTVTGATHVANGRICVSDTRLNATSGKHPGVYQVVKWNEPGPCVTGTRFGSGAPAIEDPRIGCAPRAGTYGVQDWNQPGKTIIGSGDIHAGAAAVADPRNQCDGQCTTADAFDVPGDKENGVWVILSPHGGAWHRPLTTFELAMLQGFPQTLVDGRPFQLVGKNDARWRERIGNAVPPQAAQAIAETMLLTLMAQEQNDWLMSAEEIWVRPQDIEVKEPALTH
ncbi:DNA cytosine methyltransferase [Tumebacillus sp. DT12]|uniref:DNA (cytosine-5-)-methyltransferase n=1 Tax=Tumebacillus lacus TaxID=2995335 RepID=A0ABT3X0E9_9BACL|nr:DNA cytosine methyltransferase [Tumebacillus lacus]MCX7570375.1 DNA cytosine methyltransferase [Tumebacillus lacus]